MAETMLTFTVKLPLGKYPAEITSEDGKMLIVSVNKKDLDQDPTNPDRYIFEIVGGEMNLKKRKRR